MSYLSYIRAFNIAVYSLQKLQSQELPEVSGVRRWSDTLCRRTSLQNEICCFDLYSDMHAYERMKLLHLIHYRI